jgi:hypothetical protein
MFKLDLSNTYWWPVKFAVPREAGGTVDTFTFTAEFRRLPVDESTSIFDEAAKKKAPDNDIARQLIVGWKDVMDGNGAPVPFSDVALARALTIHGFGSAVVQAYVDSLSQGAAKN